MTDIIKKFDQLYVGFQRKRNTEEDYLLAFITPYEANAAFDKRKVTVDRWAGNVHNGKIAKPSVTVDNVPLTGFRLSNEVRRTGWNGGNVVWRIEDPRGWQFEISSANLANILDQVGIGAGGIIADACVFGRVGSANILIPENSSLWKQMLEDQSKLTADKKIKTIPAKDLVVGKFYKDRSGTLMKYEGMAYLTVKNKVYDRFYRVLSESTVRTDCPVYVISAVYSKHASMGIRQYRKTSPFVHETDETFTLTEETGLGYASFGKATGEVVEVNFTTFR